jgi:hypothetical protein
MRLHPKHAKARILASSNKIDPFIFPIIDCSQGGMEDATYFPTALRRKIAVFCCIRYVHSMYCRSSSSVGISEGLWGRKGGKVR